MTRTIEAIEAELDYSEGVLIGVYAGLGMTWPGTSGGGGGGTYIKRDATNTGYTGTLSPYTGSLTITTPGTLLENLRINGQLNIRAHNCIVRNCEVLSSDYYGIEAQGTGGQGDGLLVENTRVAGGGSGSTILCDSGLVVRGCDLSVADNGIFPGSNFLIEHSYIHNLHPGSIGEAHVDGIQIGGGAHGKILGTTIYGWDTGCVTIIPDYGPVDDIEIGNCWLLNDPRQTTSVPIYAILRNGNPCTNINIHDNFMQPGSAGLYLDSTGTPGSQIAWVNNRNYDTNAVIPDPAP